MVVCNKCGKELINDSNRHLIIPAFVNLDDETQDDRYHLCDKCNEEYKKFKAKRDEEFFSKKRSFFGVKDNGKRLVLLEGKNSKSKEEVCKHEWYPVSCMLYDVEGCRGYICGKCGKLGCHCNIDTDTEVIIDDMVTGNHHYNMFYSSKLKVDEITSE